MDNVNTCFDLALAKTLYFSEQAFPVDFEKAWEWLEYSRKDNAKRTFDKCGFIEGIDYQLLISEELRPQGGFSNRNDLFLTVDCFKQWAMMSGTEKGKQVRLYFLECEKLAKESIDPAEVLIRGLRLWQQNQAEIELVKEQQQQAKIEAAVTQALAARAQELALVAASDAAEAKEGFNEVQNQLAVLREFAVAQPPGLDQDQIDQINQAFQALGGTILAAGICKDKQESFAQPWKALGLTMRNSSHNYDLNARYSNAMRQYNQDLQAWKDNGSPRGGKPTKPTRPSLLIRDGMVEVAFQGTQQVIKDYLGRLAKLFT